MDRGKDGVSKAQPGVRGWESRDGMFCRTPRSVVTDIYHKMEDLLGIPPGGGRLALIVRTLLSSSVLLCAMHEAACLHVGARVARPDLIITGTLLAVLQLCGTAAVPDALHCFSRLLHPPGRGQVQPRIVSLAIVWPLVSCPLPSSAHYALVHSPLLLNDVLDLHYTLFSPCAPTDGRPIRLNASRGTWPSNATYVSYSKKLMIASLAT